MRDGVGEGEGEGEGDGEGEGEGEGEGPNGPVPVLFHPSPPCCSAPSPCSSFSCCSHPACCPVPVPVPAMLRPHPRPRPRPRDGALHLLSPTRKDSMERFSAGFCEYRPPVQRTTSNGPCAALTEATRGASRSRRPFTAPTTSTRAGVGAAAIRDSSERERGSAREEGREGEREREREHRETGSETGAERRERTRESKR